MWLLSPINIRTYIGLNGKIYLRRSAPRYQLFKDYIILYSGPTFLSVRRSCCYETDFLYCLFIKSQNYLLHKDNSCYLVSAHHFPLPFLKFLYIMSLILETLLSVSLFVHVILTIMKPQFMQ